MSSDASAASLLDRLRPRWTRPVIVANLIAQVVIVGTGGLVRLTSSGLGCTTWPQCQPGSFVPVQHPASSFHQAIEFSNRTLTFVLVVIAAAVLALVGLDRTRGARYRALGFVPLVLVVVQAVVGGLSVLGGLPPAMVGLHLLLSMVLVVGATWLLVRHDQGDGPAVWTLDRTGTAWAIGQSVTLTVVLVLGVITTGAGPHSGDDTVGYRFSVDPYAMARIHASAVWAFVVCSVVLLVRVRSGGRARRRWAVAVLVVTAAQALIGYVQLFTGLPIALVNLHMVGAALLAATTTRFAGEIWSRDQPTVPADRGPAAAHLR